MFCPCPRSVPRRSRMGQVIPWLEEDENGALIVFDEVEALGIMGSAAGAAY